MKFPCIVSEITTVKRCIKQRPKFSLRHLCCLDQDNQLLIPEEFHNIQWTVASLTLTEKKLEKKRGFFLWYLPAIYNISEFLPSSRTVAENLFFTSAPDLAVEDSSTQGLRLWSELRNVANCCIDWQALLHPGVYLRTISRISECAPAVHWTTEWLSLPPIFRSHRGEDCSMFARLFCSLLFISESEVRSCVHSALAESCWCFSAIIIDQ